MANPIGNHWNLAKIKNSIISISTDGLNATTRNTPKWQSVYAEKGFMISVDIPGPVLYYFEATIMPVQPDKRLVKFLHMEIKHFFYQKLNIL
jgi:hypothetical protein